jgi:GR25 family glycosyltransferase involved in LPS biosynthesis
LICFYINLLHRKDRLEAIESQVRLLQELGVIERAIKIEAVYSEKNGAIGCAASHVKALNYFLFETESDAALVLEDDFEFTVDRLKLLDSFHILRKNKTRFDLVQLAYNKPIATKSDLTSLVRIFRSYTTSAYWVSRSTAYDLVSVFSQAHKNLSINENVRPVEVVNLLYAIDVAWQGIQSTKSCYGFAPPLGKQRPSFSDIVKKDVDYKV